MPVVVRFEFADEGGSGAVGEVGGLVSAVALADGEARPRFCGDVDGAAEAFVFGVEALGGWGEEVVGELERRGWPRSGPRNSGAHGHPGATFPWSVGIGEARIGLAVLSVVEQRLDAVRAVLDGADVVEVAAWWRCTGRRCIGELRGI